MSDALSMSESLPTAPETAAGASTSGSDANARSPAFARSPSSAPAPAPKSRSCVMCRSRKVRCDKQSPCSTCRRANIACIFPSADRPPRWARRLDRLTNNAAASNTVAPQDADPNVGKVMDRLRNLEGLVKELSGQLEQAHAAASSNAGGSSGVNSPGSSNQDREVEHQTDTSLATNTAGLQKGFGRLVVQDASRSRYVSSGFWSRVNDELNGLKMDTRGLGGDESDSSDDEGSFGKTPSTQELDRTPSERHAFLFRHNLSPSTSDPRDFHPLPSQIPFLVDVYYENVNHLMAVVHMPTITKMVRDLRGSGASSLTPPNEALMFSIYYAAITSMEDDDVMTNFGSSKADLNLKYRLGLEYALAKADFLNAPDIVIIQALVIFLTLVRRHDSPRFVWMMTGLLIRMTFYLGLQRDGSHFEHLTPFEIETRRKLWWFVRMLDDRASEDQGTEPGIVGDTYDTKMPLNINEADLDPESEQMPIEREGVTDRSFGRIFLAIGVITRQMLAPGAMHSEAGLEGQSRLLNEIYTKFEEGHLQHATDQGNITYWVGVNIARLVMAKMTLYVYLPVLFSSSSEHSEEIRDKLLVAAIEVAEYNHALNAEQACRKWRWIYQTYTHWHAIVYLTIETSRRPWSPIAERAWVALHSTWLIPAQNPMFKNFRVWIPLRKLMAKAHQHRDAELNRLRVDLRAAAKLEMEDHKIPVPSSSGPFPSGSSVDIFRERWRKLVGMPEGSGSSTQMSGFFNAEFVDPSLQTTYTSKPAAGYVSPYSNGEPSSNMNFEPAYLSTGIQQASQNGASPNFGDLQPATTTPAPSELVSGQTAGSSFDPFQTVTADWSDGSNMEPGVVPWTWADGDPSVDMFSNLEVDPIDVNMDLDSDMDWYNWVESAKGIDWDTGISSNV